ncbi:MAG: T9SS type A sorting domain-containing protein, partial [Flavobacteriales bacterium]|nr:T9SS type A sorting domain-containing protein [Flavobacteriales bacterium]
EYHKTGKVIIYDYLGQMIQTQELASSMAGQELEIDISDEPQGVYLIKLILDDSISVYKTVFQ